MTKKMRWAALLGVFLSASVAAYAHSEGSAMSGGNWKHGGGQSQCPVADKLMMKSYFLLEKKDDLKLTDDQVKTIKDIKLQAEKDLIRQKGDGEIFRLDLKSKLGEDKIDVEGTNALIDKNFASMAADTKANLAAYVKLKDVLTPEQAAKMKELHKQREHDKEEK